MVVVTVGLVMVVMLCRRSAPTSQILCLVDDGLYIGLVIDGTGCESSFNPNAATWALNDSVIGGLPFISRYELIFVRLDFIVGSVSFSLYRYASNSLILLGCVRIVLVVYYQNILSKVFCINCLFNC